jgi:hypothetical protein
MAAVLEDALRCARQEEQDDSWREASRWVFSNDRSYIFSFLSVCDALRMDYGWLRMLVRSESNQKVGRLRRLPDRIETESSAPLRWQTELHLRERGKRPQSGRSCGAARESCRGGAVHQ